MTVPLTCWRSRRSSSGCCLGLPSATAASPSGSTPSSRTRPSDAGPRTSFTLFGMDGVLILISVAVAVLGIGRAAGTSSASSISQPREALVRAWTQRAKPLYTASFHKWYFDDLNDLLFVRFGGLVAASLWWFDRASSTAPSTASHTRSSRPGPRSATSRPGACRTTRWESPPA